MKTEEMDFRIKELTEKARKAYAEAGDDVDLSRVTSLTGTVQEKAQALKAINDEIKQLQSIKKTAEERKAIDKSLGITSQYDGRMFGGLQNDSPATKTLGMPRGKSYREMFGYGNGSLDTKGFKSLGQFLNTIASGRSDERLTELKTMLEGTPNVGGYAVPIQMAAMLFDNSLEAEIVRPRATVWPMTSETRKVPAWDGYDHTSNVFGGFIASWLTENATGTRRTPTLREISLTAYKLALFTQASLEMVQDAPMITDGALELALQKAIGWYLDDAFFNGSGANQPLGILNDSGIITATRDTSAEISYADVVRMFARLYPACVKNAVWVANPKTLPELMTLTIATGTNSGAFVPAVQQSSGNFYLLTRPLLVTEHLPTIGTKGDIMLVDLSSYCIGMRQEILIDRSNAPGWTEAAIDFRGIVRADGKPMWKTYVTPKAGDTLSWCVVLETK